VIGFYHREGGGEIGKRRFSAEEKFQILEEGRAPGPASRRYAGGIRYQERSSTSG